MQRHAAKPSDSNTTRTSFRARYLVVTTVPCGHSFLCTLDGTGVRPWHSRLHCYSTLVFASPNVKLAKVAIYPHTYCDVMRKLYKGSCGLCLQEREETRGIKMACPFHTLSLLFLWTLSFVNCQDCSVTWIFEGAGK